MSEFSTSVGFLYHFYVISDYRKGMVDKTEREIIETLKENVLETVRDLYKKKIPKDEMEVLPARSPFRNWVIIGVKVSLTKPILKKFLPLIFTSSNNMRAVKNCEVAGTYIVFLIKSSTPIPRTKEINELLNPFYTQYGTDTFANIVLRYKTESDNVLVRFGAEDSVFYGINIASDGRQTKADLSRDIQASLSDIFLHYTIVKCLFEKYETEMKLFYGFLTSVHSPAEETRECTKSRIEELIKRAQGLRIEDTETVEDYLTELMDYLMILDSKHTYINGIQNEINDNIANLEFSFSLLEPRKYLDFPSLFEDLIRECELVKTGYKDFIADVVRYEDTLNNVVNLTRGRLETLYLKTQLLCSKESINLTKASERSRKSIELLTLVFASLGLSQVLSAFLIFWLESNRELATVLNVTLYCFWSLAIPIVIVASIYFIRRRRRGLTE